MHTLSDRRIFGDTTPLLQALAMFLLLASTACTFGKTEEVRYNTYEDVEKAGALLGGGYLPTFFPKSAVSINAMHNSSTYQILLKFQFSEAERGELIKNCRQVEVGKVTSPGLNAAWWPKDLKRGNVANSRHVYYYCPADEGFLALATGEAYFWRL